MNLGRLFALGIIVASGLAGIGYGVAGDWRRAIYWIAAAVLNASVTW